MSENEETRNCNVCGAALIETVFRTWTCPAGASDEHDEREHALKVQTDLRNAVAEARAWLNASEKFPAETIESLRTLVDAVDAVREAEDRCYVCGKALAETPDGFFQCPDTGKPEHTALYESQKGGK